MWYQRGVAFWSRLVLDGEREIKVRMSGRKPFLARLKNAVAPVVIHGIGMIVSILFLWATDLVLQLTMGPNAMFFGAVPCSRT